MLEALIFMILVFVLFLLLMKISDYIFKDNISSKGIRRETTEDAMDLGRSLYRNKVIEYNNIHNNKIKIDSAYESEKKEILDEIYN